MGTVLRKDEIHRIVDELPDNATLGDLMHKLYVIECIEQGLAASREGRVIDVKDVREKFGLSS